MTESEQALKARVEALEWVIQAAISTALEAPEGRSDRRPQVIQHLTSVLSAEPSDGRESERALMSVTEAADILGIGRSKAYDLIRTGELPSVQLGRGRLVPRHLLIQWIGSVALAAPEA